MGGRGGGRSYASSQYQIAHLVQNTKPFRGALMRLIHSDIRNSNWQELKDRVSDSELEKHIDLSDSTMSAVCGKNSLNAVGFHKSQSDRTAKLKSLANYTHAFIEEAEEIGEEEFRQLDDSLRAEGAKIILTLNTPYIEHWIVQRWFKTSIAEKGFYNLEPKDEIEWISTSHKDNFYLPEDVHERYEKYKITNPAYYWQMIAGLAPETILGRIYTDWREINQIPHNARLMGYGLDFGFAVDPDAITAVYYYDGGYILDEELYVSHNQTGNLIDFCKGLKEAPIVCDNNEPRTIAAIRGAGLPIIETEKGKDSVDFGIKHLQSLRISYTSRSINLKNEYQKYAWMLDKEGNNKKVPEPRCADHLLDSARYFLTRMVRPADIIETSKTFELGNSPEFEKQHNISRFHY